MELRESDTLQNKIDFPSIGKNVIFGKKKNLFFSTETVETKLKTSQCSFLAGCKVSECALVGPSAHGMSPEVETISIHAEKSDEENPASLASQPLCILDALSQGSSHHFNLLCLHLQSTCRT